MGVGVEVGLDEEEGVGVGVPVYVGITWRSGGGRGSAHDEIPR